MSLTVFALLPTALCSVNALMVNVLFLFQTVFEKNNNICYSLVKTMMAEAPLTSISIMHNGTTLAVGSTRGKIYIYDLRQGATPIRTMTAHRSSVQHLQFQQSIKPTKVYL